MFFGWIRYLPQRLLNYVDYIIDERFNTSIKIQIFGVAKPFMSLPPNCTYILLPKISKLSYYFKKY